MPPSVRSAIGSTFHRNRSKHFLQKSSLQPAGPRRCALLVAILALLVIVSGAFITSAEAVARLSQATASPAPHDSLHLSPNIGMAHALLAHVFLSLIAVIAVATSAGWNREPELVDGSNRLLLRPLVLAIPPVVILQITLGAAYRHYMSSIVPHMAIAMGVVFLVLIGCSVILQNAPKPASMRRAAATMIALVVAQVCLGITAFLMLLLNVTRPWYFVLTTVGHVTVGAITLGAIVVLAMEVRRSVTRKSMHSAYANAVQGKCNDE